MKYLFTAALFISAMAAHGQDPLRFKSEVDNLVEKYSNTKSKNLIVFTGSSSVRLWSDLNERFPDKNIINTGFGGSQTSELYYYSEELILQYQPEKVFIYEGDNDLGAGKTPSQILADDEKLLKLLRCRLGKKANLYFITPKPSILRWDKRSLYEEYIKGLKEWAQKQKRVFVVDVWTPMMDEKGELNKTLFIEDNLHMNKGGYDIWTNVIRPYLD